MTNRRVEGQMIKKATQAVLPEAKIRVCSGRGTAYGWWSIYITSAKPADCTCHLRDFGTCDPCRAEGNMLRLAAEKSAEDSGATIYTYTDDMNYKHTEVNAHVELI